MEFFLLPLLLLGLALTTLDSGGSDDGNDTLNGSGTETVSAGAGDDHLSLTDHATGFGGTGDDTITASADATGYGRSGDDSLTGSDNATVMGGDGNDVLDGTGDAFGFGGAGNDTLLGADGATLAGGLGDDHLTLTDAAQGYGGAGDDTLMGGGHNTGGVGRDSFVISDLEFIPIDGGDFEPQFTPMTITDFNPAQDTLGIVFEGQPINDLSVRSAYDSTTDITTVELRGGRYEQSCARFALEGEHVFDAGNLQFYSDQNLTPIAFNFDGTAGNDVFSGTGHPAGTSEAHGEGGDDQLHLQNGAVYGNEGNDTLSGEDRLQGDEGDEGDDVLTVLAAKFGGERDEYHGEVHGGAGNDTLLSTGGYPGVDRLMSTFFGGAGDDYIQVDNGTIDAGTGDDIILHGFAGAQQSGYAAPTRYEYFTENGASLELRGEFDRTTTLGAGADTLAITHLGDGGGSVVMDFDPARDQIALILPVADRAASQVSLTTNAQSGFLELQITTADEVKSILLKGVSTGFDLSSVHLFANEAAVLAQTPYATL